jgi:hypothetical protein
MSARILNWWYTIQMRLQTNRIATAACEETWLQVRSKAATLSAAERAEYLRVHAASVVQRHVDKLVQEDPAIPGSAANQLVVNATECLVRRLSRRLGKPVPSVAVGAR